MDTASSAQMALELATRELENCLPTYSPPAVKVIVPDDISSADSTPPLETLLVARGRHKPGPAGRAAQYVRRVAPLARTAVHAAQEDEILATPPLVAALNALALIFAVTSRQDDVLDQLDKILYQASRVPVSRTSTSSDSSDSLSDGDSDELAVAASVLLTSVLGLLRGALRKAGPPGTLRGRAPLGGAQAYSAAKIKLNDAVSHWDAAVRGFEDGSDE